MDKIDESNFILFAAKFYDNPQCMDESEFFDDLKRFKYLKRLFNKYKEGGELKERLVLNHLIVLYNLFEEGATRMLFFKLRNYLDILKPLSTPGLIESILFCAISLMNLLSWIT